MEPLPMGRYNPHSSKKRVSTGSGDCPALMDEDVVEIPPPPSFAKSKSAKQKQKQKQKQVMCPEVIDVDNDEDLMIIEEKYFHDSKGKISAKSHLSGDDVIADPTDVVNLSHGLGSISHSVSVEGESGQGMNYWDDYHGDFNCNAVVVDDEFAMLQAHFDSIDVPPGVEAAIPWWPSSEDSKKQGVSASASSSAFIAPSSFSNAGTSKIDNPQSLQTYKESLETRVRSVKPKRKHFLTKSSGERKYSAAPRQPGLSHILQQSTAWTGSPSSTAVKPSWLPNPSVAAAENSLPAWAHLPPKITYGASQPFFGWNNFGADKLAFPHLTQNSFIEVTDGGFHHFQDPSVVLDQGIAAEISVPLDLACSHQPDNGEALTLKRLESFKKFDTVQDHSDHHYSSKKHSQPSKGWVKKIQEEWRILEKDLPDTIFVRVYETRMDLLRAVIIGADGTPYHDGIFFFDVHFPLSYPNVPPLVYYHSGGLRLNPNLYNCGKVCLSLLNTWSGSSNEKWVPGLSTTLQILVSIQGLILNTKPYFNEPGYVGMEGSPSGEKQSEVYNENTFLLSLKTMLYSMRRPPKYFDDFVYGHFYKHAHEILIACKSYLDGAQVGTLVKGGIQDVDAGDKSCSNTFKMHLPMYINSLVKVFTKMGVQDCEKYSLPLNENSPVAEAPSSSSSSRKALALSYRKKLPLKFKKFT